MMKKKCFNYKRFPYLVYANMLEAGTKSIHGNKYGGYFTTKFGCTRSFPMHKKSQYHKGM